MKLFLPLSVFFLVMVNSVFGQHTSYLTQHYNNTRAGWNNTETKLTVANVNTRQFGKQFTLPVDDQVYSQPLVVADVTINGAKHNVVYIATVNNSLYAFDGENGTLFWQKNFTVNGLRPPKHTDMTNACGGFYNDFSGNMGIVGTPVIDSAAQIIYFVARSTNGTNYYQYIHAVNIVTGAERSGSPVLITASCPGNGDGSVNGVVNWDPQKNNQRQGLTLVNGTLYITFSSHCDWGPYHGWVLGYNASTLTQKYVYNDTPNGYQAGIWEAGGAPAVDNLGNLYVVTGNGSVGYNGDPANTINRGESALKLTPSGNTLAITSFYTPMNWQQMEGADLDYGGMESFLIPNSNFYFTGAKDGSLHLLNKDNMGGYSSTSNNVQQTVPLNTNNTLRCQPSYFKGLNAEYVFLWSENGPLTAFPFDRSTNTLDVAHETTSGTQGPYGASGAELSVSSNGSIDNTGVLWASYSANGDANQSVRPGVLRAFEANNVTHELWNNLSVASRDSAGNFAKFSAPTIANGHVYLATFSNSVAVYGIILDSVAMAACPDTDLALNRPVTVSSYENATTLPASAAVDGDLTTRWGSQFSDPQWMYVDLGKTDSICRVTIDWEKAIGKDFSIQVSDDAQNWTNVISLTGNTNSINYIDMKARGRYVRMYGTARATEFGYSIYEFNVQGKAIDVCPSPTNLSVANITTSSAQLKWTYSGAQSYVIRYYSGNSNLYKTVTSTLNYVTIRNLSCSNTYKWQIASVCNGVTGTFSSLSQFNTTSCTNCGLLPTRTVSTDVGSLLVAGWACNTGITSYNLVGGGIDIAGTADQFHYMYKTFAGDGILQAKITSMDKISSFSKAGIMFRESPDSTSRNIFVGVSPGSGLYTQIRTATAGNTTINNTLNINTPYFLRLVKQGNTYITYTSPDSINWLQGNAQVNMMNSNGPITGGIAVTSHYYNKMINSQFDQTTLLSYGGSQTNLALNKPTFAQDYNGSTHYPKAATDGDTTTYWNGTSGDPKWWYVDLGQRFKLSRVYINWATKWARIYSVQLSNDAVNWRTISQINYNTIRQNNVLINDTARFVRINGIKSATNNGYSINEVQIFGDTIPNITENIAQNKALVSTSDKTGFVAKNATDGDFTTRWESGSDANEQGLSVDLGTIYSINGVNITWGTRAKSFLIQTSNDGATWATIKSVANNEIYNNFISVSGIGRYIRVYGTSHESGENYSIYDLQVTGNQFIPPPSGNAVTVNNIIVYPNPTTNGEATISFNSLSNQTVEVFVTDMAGNRISDKKVTCTKGTQNLPVSLSGALPGKYSVTIKTDKGASTAIVIKSE